MNNQRTNLKSCILEYLSADFQTCSHSSEKRLLAPSGPSVSISADPTGTIYAKYIRDLYENLSRNSNFCSNPTKVSDASHEELQTSHCCRRHVLATRAVSCDIADSDDQLNNTHRTHRCVSSATMITQKRLIFTSHYVTILPIDDLTNVTFERTLKVKILYHT